ncbi:MAG: cytochrome c biogenesis protein CcsA [Anaerolineae bacterium]|nr:cytochrome c biogenesis protein CcsA [Anaerolineae bacterium]
MTQSQTQPASRRPALLTGLTVIAAAMFVIGLGMALFYAPTDQQGDVQRIFYVHLGAFMGGSLAFFIAAVASVLYLIRREQRWDTLALSSIEVGLVLAGFNIVSGAVWARPIWNTWWTWDPRLTSAAIMWLAYAAYLMLRNGIEDPGRRGRFAAVYGILAFSSVIFTTVVTRLRPDTIHPVVVGPSPQNAQGTFEVGSSAMTVTLVFNILTYIMIAITLTWHRVRLEAFAQRVQMLKLRLLSR